jgi:hypothetical protein
VYARVSIFEGGNPDQIDDSLQQARDEVLPRAKQASPSGRAKKRCVPLRRRLASCAKSRQRLAGKR